MGSTISIRNDTNHDVWITQGVNRDVLFWVTFSFFDLTALGDDLIVDEIFASFKEGKARFRMSPEDKIILSEEAESAAAVEYPEVTLADLTEKGWTRMKILQACSKDALAKVLEISDANHNRDKLIKPDANYTWYGTLSLTMRVYVMNDKLQFDNKACFTGPTPGSKNEYTITEYFKKLDKD